MAELHDDLIQTYVEKGWKITGFYPELRRLLADEIEDFPDSCVGIGKGLPDAWRLEENILYCLEVEVSNPISPKKIRWYDWLLEALDMVAVVPALVVCGKYGNESRIDLMARHYHRMGFDMPGIFPDCRLHGISGERAEGLNPQEKQEPATDV